MPGPRAGLPHARARDLRPRGPGLDARQYRAGRDRKRSARLLPVLRARERRLGGRQEYDRHLLARDQRPRHCAGTHKGAAGSIPCGMGRLAPDRHARADRRWIAGLVACRPRRRSAVLAAVRARDARIPRCDLSARQAGGTTGPSAVNLKFLSVAAARSSLELQIQTRTRIIKLLVVLYSEVRI